MSTSRFKVTLDWNSSTIRFDAGHLKLWMLVEVHSSSSRRLQTSLEADCGSIAAPAGHAAACIIIAVVTDAITVAAFAVPVGVAVALTGAAAAAAAESDALHCCLTRKLD